MKSVIQSVNMNFNVASAKVGVKSESLLKWFYKIVIVFFIVTGINQTIKKFYGDFFCHRPTNNFCTPNFKACSFSVNFIPISTRFLYLEFNLSITKHSPKFSISSLVCNGTKLAAQILIPLSNNSQPF